MRIPILDVCLGQVLPTVWGPNVPQKNSKTRNHNVWTSQRSLLLFNLNHGLCDGLGYGKV